jgi:hypothetical protein
MVSVAHRALRQELILVLLFRLSLPYLSPSFLVYLLYGIWWILFSPENTCLGGLYGHVEFAETVFVRWSIGNLFMFASGDTLLLKNRSILHLLFSS